MFEHVVVIVDGSKTSEYAVNASITVAREVGGDITYCVTIDPDLFGEGIGVASFAELAFTDCERLLSDAIDRARRNNIPNVTGRILREDPVHAVVETARAQQCDLIMMGLAPRVGILRPFMRSLAEEVLCKTNIPLCVMRRPARGWLSRRLLVPIVDDGLANIAIDHAIDFALQFRAVLIFSSIESSKNDASLRRLGEAAKARAHARGIETEELLLPLDGEVPNTIAKIADISACDAIIMASRVRTGWPRLIEGSVSAAVVYASDVPVILVRKP